MEHARTPVRFAHRRCTLDAGTLSIKTIFGQTRRHIVPLFQRPYVWKREKQWSPFWDDVRSVADRLLDGQEVRPHFLGAIVVDLLPRPLGQVECRLLIDGQQRLSTIQLMLEAFADACLALGAERHHRALLQYTRNNDPLSNDPVEVFKVWPTNSDQDHFRRVMEAGNPESLRKEYGRQGSGSLGNLIADAYVYFYEEVSGWLTTEDGFTLEERVDALFRTLSECIRLVAIDLGPQDDAQLIFETLNARGTPLLPSDLVKNHLFHKSQVEGHDIDALYREHWKPFDTDAAFWRAEQGRGHARRPVLDTFLMHFLTLKTQDDVPTAYLYGAFKEYVDDQQLAPVAVLRELQRYGEIFQGLRQGKTDGREGAFFRRLEAMDVITAYPFLLELYSRFGGAPEELGAVLLDLESWLVRRMLCQLSTRGYNRLFVDFLGVLNEGAGTVSERFRAQLLSSDADNARWPGDSEFEEAWMTLPVYRSLTQSRVRLVLEGLERHLRSEKKEDLFGGQALPIEHLMPQSWRTHYPLPADVVDVETAAAHRDSLANTFGNLTLLTQKLNSSVSNGPWDDKREQILLYSNLALNQSLRFEPVWDESAIADRGRALFREAVKVWPRPSA